MRALVPEPPRAPRQRPALPRVAWLAAAALAFAGAVAGGIAWATRDPGPGARGRVAAAVVPATPAAAFDLALPPAQTAGAPGRRAAAAPPPELSAASAAAVLAAIAPVRLAPPEVVKKVTAEATAQLETYRPSIVKECWPADGLPRGAKSAKVTIHVTFDAQGREIARGISEERRAPTGAFGKCLRALPGTNLSVSPPGTNVAVSMAMTYP
jgi:hypothetical protein